MALIPLVIYSKLGPPIADFKRRAVLPLDFVDLKELSEPSVLQKHLGSRVVLMKTGYEGELHDRTCYAAVLIEQAFRARGARIVNPVNNIMRAHRKDQWYCTLRLQGVSVPYCLPNPTVYEIMSATANYELSLPFIYRLADSAGGRGMFLVESLTRLDEIWNACPRHEPFPGAARLLTLPKRILDRLRRATGFSIETKAIPRNYRTVAFPYYRTAAVEFVRDKFEDYFACVRAVVVGDRIDMQARLLSLHWNSHLTTYANSPKQLLETQKRINIDYHVPDSLRDDILRIGRVMGLECYAVDALTPPASRHVVLDINPLYSFRESDDGRDPEHYRGHFERVARYLHSLTG